MLTLEYLAELTMAILSHLRSRDKKAGYVTDFPELLKRLAPVLGEKPRVADRHQRGGINPPACSAGVAKSSVLPACERRPTGVVTGDDVLALISPIGWSEGINLAHLETGAPDLERGRSGWWRRTCTSVPGQSRTHCNKRSTNRGDRAGRRRLA